MLHCQKRRLVSLHCYPSLSEAAVVITSLSEAGTSTEHRHASSRHPAPAPSTGSQHPAPVPGTQSRHPVSTTCTANSTMCTPSSQHQHRHPAPSTQYGHPVSTMTQSWENYQVDPSKTQLTLRHCFHQRLMFGFTPLCYGLNRQFGSRLFRSFGNTKSTDKTNKKERKDRRAGHGKGEPYHPPEDSSMTYPSE